MFDSVRKHQRVLQFVLMLFIVPSFALFGISSYSGFMDKETDIVKVNGRPITAQEVDIAAKRQAERVGGMQPPAGPTADERRQRHQGRHDQFF